MEDVFDLFEIEDIQVSFVEFSSLDIQGFPIKLFANTILQTLRNLHEVPEPVRIGILRIGTSWKLRFAPFELE